MGKNFVEKLKVECDAAPLGILIKRDTAPIFIWGIGALSTDVHRYCKSWGIEIEGFFVNIPASESTFEGLSVWTLEDLIHSYPKFSVIIGHSNYAEGTAFLREFENVSSVYCVPCCCYGIQHMISSSFFEENSDLLDRFYGELADTKSKQCLRTYFESRINDNAEYMFPCFEKGIDYYRNDILTFSENEVLMDVGACKGAAIWPFVEAVNGKYSQIIALEPEDKNYSCLEESIKERRLTNVVIKKVCAFNKNGQVKFSGGEELGGIQETAEHFQIYPAATIDSLCQELGPHSAVSIIKINFPFSVPEILQGAGNLLKTRRPKLIIRTGFDENVLMETYRTIKEINPMYQVYLRYTLGIPQGLTIFAV